MGTWVDFNSVKQTVTMEMVLGRYNIDWLRKTSGGELRGRCPVHGGKDPTFQASTVKNNFQCFVPACGAKGNVLDFVAAMDKCSVREAALKLQDWFQVAGNGGGGRSGNTASPPASAETGSQLAAEKIGLPAGQAGDRGEPASAAVGPNKPLNFTLKGIDHAHAYLRERGITKETAEYFGVGFFAGKGSMSGRVVIPIHNWAGELVAYVGRVIDGTEPRYKLPGGFHKSQELFNLHRATAEEGSGLIVVEGFFDAMKVHQAGYPYVVALMGCSLSEEQEQLVLAHARMVLIMLDGDDTGRKGTDECLLRLGRKVWTKAITVPEGKQPDMLTAEELAGLLGQ